VAAETEIGISCDQHLLIHRAVRIMAGRATFLHRAMLEDERTLLLRMALGAGFALAFQVGSGALDRIAGVNIVAIYAGDFPGKNRMGIWQTELAPLIKVTGETGFGRLARIDDRPFAPAGLHVLAAWTMASFATGRSHFRVSERQLGVRRRREMIHLIFMALHTRFRADKLGARDIGRSQDGTVNRDAGDEQQAPQGDAAENDGIFSPAFFGDHGGKNFGLSFGGVMVFLVRHHAP